MKQAQLILDDGSTFTGWSVGHEGNTAGEVVFNTAMTGYPESLTDPSYAGQMLVMTYPLTGNYGVPSAGKAANGLPLFLESDHIHPSALIMADYSEAYSHWNAQESLAAWLKRCRVPALTGIDTRRLTMRLREQGVMTGRIIVEGHETEPIRLADYADVNWVERVSCKRIICYRPDGTVASEGDDSLFVSGTIPRVVLVDCGVKANIIRCLIKRGLEVVRVPWDYDFNRLEFDGLFLANGPGDPEQCGKTIEHIRTFLNNQTVRPCMGICLGNQLLAKAAGASTYKLKYGHRSHNQPVRQMGTTRCFITSQNHGYAVDATTLPRDWQPLFVNINDGSNEGIRHVSRPWFSAQFHPEACSGPTDTEFLFDEFTDCINDSQKKHIQ